MRIRLGETQDWPFIHDLSKKAMSFSASAWRKQTADNAQIYRENILKDLWKWFQQPETLALIAEDEAEGRVFPVGYLLLLLDSRDELTGLKQGWIMDLAVLPSKRGKGIGRFLLEAAEQHCREAGLAYLGLAVTSSNERALKLYQNSGFAEERKLMVKILTRESKN